MHWWTVFYKHMGYRLFKISLSACWYWLSSHCLYGLHGSSIVNGSMHALQLQCMSAMILDLFNMLHWIIFSKWACLHLFVSIRVSWSVYKELITAEDRPTWWYHLSSKAIHIWCYVAWAPRTLIFSSKDWKCNIISIMLSHMSASTAYYMLELAQLAIQEWPPALLALALL